ncbi:MULTISPECIES: copper homeostasis protein CutC [unclassified Enterococcus]|uniref:copper homeostasis protein CutC n=1 Tax=unclassified Enterococcus TaxID=2608891 RepID=UPI0015535C32|nr:MULTISPECIES: copper homeostasis protein CutC [unclassified Enterococcus]MBS7578056.1 copper homeostasis protein CutC [Enterococcus sp. MMGLQ5-2]MBS7585254.1 copper homeostasis protein CutC [Enterococcus sp. MMGLQ5-1]NPD13111.1 copper homeostasis protein CutC [Enterococcus sp. MMGLQ5-1]NPD37887.1 copper homeostasis protein CutC [Enterococcus sp. MMGLQ5-2]
MIKEFCAENYTELPKAIKAGAARIELCDNLTVGGTTPSYAVIEESVKYAHEYDATIMTMIRPRGGNFVYHDIEIKIMETDILKAIEAGSDGVVFGCLTKDNELDYEAMETLLIAAEGVQIVFHMAFDAISFDKQLEALDWLAAHGVTRILTHGGPASKSIQENIAHLKELINYANGRIEILIGGGVNAENYQDIANETGAKQVHGTKIVKF